MNIVYFKNEQFHILNKTPEIPLPVDTSSSRVWPNGVFYVKGLVYYINSAKKKTFTDIRARKSETPNKKKHKNLLSLN